MTSAQMMQPRDWLQVLARYKEADPRRSVIEIFVTAIPFVLLWTLAYKALEVSYALTLLLCIPTGLFLTRLFLIQHDCGHGAFFSERETNDWVGRIIGIVTLTPYEVWRRSHATHHATHGNLDKRGIGDIDTLTVAEYKALSPLRKLGYRLYRNPIVMFGIGPAYIFLIQNRLPAPYMSGGWRPWLSAMGTNVSIAIVSAGMIWLVGWKAFLMVHLPTTLVAATVGVWLFYVQHQFEETFWAKGPEWTHPDGALNGSSHYDLPPVLRWLTANIGIHHVHHLYSRIPYYRLGQVIKDHPELGQVHRITMWESFACLKLRLWDENKKRMVSFREALA